MHETGVCRHIVETVEQCALEGHAKRVTRVCLELGEVHDIVPEILAGAFEWMCRGTVAEGCELVIERVPFTVRCQCCGEVYRLDYLDETTWPCPLCQARDYRLHTGREFSIKSIEVEGYAAHEVDESSQCLAALHAARAAKVPAASLAVAGKRPAA